jgi:phosphoglucosamine mutase
MVAAVRFGTDGIRGRAHDEVTVDVAYRLGWAVARVLATTVYVGYDTRESSPELAGAVLAGLAAGGAPAMNLGLFTTPGVAVIASQRHGAGVVVSASHNPYYDNGLKVLGVGGAKLDVATEEAITAALAQAPSPSEAPAAVPIDEGAEDEYLEHLRSLVPVDLSGLHLVIDCANGAASHVAPALFAGTGARVTVLHDRPDGRNINEGCGSTDVGDLVATVLALGADLGLAFDGDADRLVAVDHRGHVRDGDDLMVLFALDLASRDELGGGLVVTTMSNLGLRRALGAAEIAVCETEVGDRNVMIALEEVAWRLGGEQSGHVIFADVAPTGDGLLTALTLCELVTRRGPLFDQADAAWRRVPQSLVNVAKSDFDLDVVDALFDELVTRYGVTGDEVRLLVRPSGTEPVVRVMIESTDERVVAEFTERLHAHFRDPGSVKGPRVG